MCLEEQVNQGVILAPSWVPVTDTLRLGAPPTPPPHWNTSISEYAYARCHLPGRVVPHRLPQDRAVPAVILRSSPSPPSASSFVIPSSTFFSAPHTTSDFSQIKSLLVNTAQPPWLWPRGGGLGLLLLYFLLQEEVKQLR